jgi:hypothetical protein
MSGSLDERHQNWSERYRPTTTLDEYVFASMSEVDERTVRKVHAGDSMKNFLFYGPPGSGKSSMSRCQLTDDRMAGSSPRHRLGRGDENEAHCQDDRSHGGSPQSCGSICDL